MTDLGYANGWKETPEIVKNCRPHPTQHPGYYVKLVGNCLTEYGCTECGYKYLVDSSG